MTGGRVHFLCPVKTLLQICFPPVVAAINILRFFSRRPRALKVLHRKKGHVLWSAGDSDKQVLFTFDQKGQSGIMLFFFFYFSNVIVSTYCTMKSGLAREQLQLLLKNNKTKQKKPRPHVQMQLWGSKTSPKCVCNQPEVKLNPAGADGTWGKKANGKTRAKDKKQTLPQVNNSIKLCTQNICRAN